jgi:aldose sugar dehydrogenase
MKHYYYFLFVVLISLQPNRYCIGQAPVFIKSQIGTNKIVNNPNSMNLGSDNFLWITERTTGVVVRIDPITAARDELIKIPVYSASRQDGLLGICFGPKFNQGEPFLYLTYTYFENNLRKQRIVRYTYSISNNNGILDSPMTLIEGLPASNDHNSGKIELGPDQKLYYTIGDQGGNQNANWCQPILSQVLPTAAEISSKDWKNYPGKILRLNLDGSIPNDNPIMNGVKSHIYTYGHRNAQGLNFGANGVLYSNEHGPDTDDEVNIIKSGSNYGWPRVVGFKDNQAYDYCNYGFNVDCASIPYDKAVCPPKAQFFEESSFNEPNYQEPIFTLFSVKDDYNYDDPKCQNSWVCRPNIAPSSMVVYESDAIPAWKNSLLLTSLKRGRVYILKLDPNGGKVVGEPIEAFYTQNRYRDIAVSPDGKEIFILTDETGNTTGPTGLTQATSLINPSAILKYTLSTVSNGKEVQTNSNQFSLSPNPVQDQLELEMESDNYQNVKGEIISSFGQIMKSWTMQSKYDIISTNTLPSGAYMLRLSSEKGISSKLFVKL